MDKDKINREYKAIYDEICRLRTLPQQNWNRRTGCSLSRAYLKLNKLRMKYWIDFKPPLTQYMEWFLSNFPQ